MVTSAGGVLAAAAVACGQPAAPPSAVAPSDAPPRAPAPSPAVPPPDPQPIADGPCPYLTAGSVQAANGERVTAVRVSGTGPNQPYPACFFLTYHDAVQLRTWIVVATPRTAGATIDAVAPVATSDLAELPGGWSGGSQPTPNGAVFAVARQGTAVVVTTNQRQTIGARRIAQQVIATLGL
ncbi:MAG TPA: DUF2020 domain-containing protein [Pseudonocardiaceae bacterium]|jgi:hypothetical protein|nr:DUF2020 domain-containing protein [Pseudonocardiaceae bacterium]